MDYWTDLLKALEQKEREKRWAQWNESQAMLDQNATYPDYYPGRGEAPEWVKRQRQALDLQGEAGEEIRQDWAGNRSYAPLRKFLGAK